MPDQQPPATSVATTTAAAASDGLRTFDAAWSAIRETYVDDARSEADWDALREEMRARAARASSADEVRGVLRDLLARIGKSHFDLLSPAVRSRLDRAAAAPDQIGTVGVDLTPVGGDLVVARVSGARTPVPGLLPGSTIEAIDGVTLRDVSGSASAPATDFQRWATAQSLLRGTTGTTATLVVRQPGRSETTTLTVERVREQGEPVTLGHLPTFFARLDQHMIEATGRRIAVVRFNVWMVPLSPAIDRAIDTARAADGIVLDLRGNPGGVLSMLMGISGHFLEDPVRLGTLRTRESELNLVANPRLVNADGKRVTPFRGPLAILVDQTSYSASEIFAGGMQAIGRARVFGQRTPGGALPAMLRELPSGDVLEYAIGDFVTATGQRIEGHGVEPDQIVVPTREALAEGRDEVLDAAVRWAAGDAAAEGR